MTPDLLPGFDSLDLTVDGVALHARTAGNGPPVLLLHGYPQTHLMWHRIAPTLARTHTVVLPDLRGYGDSAKPPGGADHAAYAKRAMAADQVGLMRQLGHERFAVVGHDRGARVAHRMCLDHPDAVTRAAVIDIAPTRHMFATADTRFALAYWHWFFLAQPADLPEQLIGADPAGFLRGRVAAWSRTPGCFDERALAEYVRCFSPPEAVAASCEDYRAAAGIDLEHDGADVAAGHGVACPLLVLWGADGFVGATYDLLAVWGEHATSAGLVRGNAVPGGHFCPEESPDETLAALEPFLAGET